MYHKHHTKGLILESRGEGDGSLRVRVLTKSFGLISARVQGARLPASKLKSGCQEFSLGDFSFIKGKTGWKLVSTQPEKNFFEGLKNYKSKVVVMGNVLALSKKLLGEEENSAPIFSLVSNFLFLLEKAKEDDVVVLECLTLMKILFVLGYMKDDPELLLPISSSDFRLEGLKTLLPRRGEMIYLINESLKAASV